jgi:CRP-like cAMP-binding protein
LNNNNLIFKNLPKREFKKGQLIIFQGEVPRCGYVLNKGIIKEYDISKQGNEQTTWLVNKYEVFPFPWIMGVSKTASYYYETASDCELYILEKEDYLKLLKNNESFLYNELLNQAKKESSQTRRIGAILNTKAKFKLANTFHYLIDSYGSLSSNKFIIINIPLTHQDIANLTGLTRETVSKELGILRKEKVIIPNIDIIA